ncbi:MAG: hypothetical protein Q8934_01400 [Bacillota bacterium]|nr:hypothetical protein [Bacillota bacterium]
MKVNNTFLSPFITIVSSIIVIKLGVKIMEKSSRRIWLANMIGGIIFSQIQTEYLIWRINKRTNQMNSPKAT